MSATFGTRSGMLQSSSIDSVWSWSLEADKMRVASLKKQGSTVRMGRMVEYKNLQYR